MTACSCPPDDCHGGHTIDVGPSWVCVPDDRLRQFRDDPTVAHTTAERSMAAELLALRARVTTMEAHAADLINAESERARLSLYARNARRVIDTLWKSRRGHQSRASMQARMYRRARHSEAETRRDHDALAARVTELEAEVLADERAIEEARDERDAARDRAAEADTDQPELIGFAVVSTAGQDDYLCLASDLLHRRADTAHGELIMSRAESPSTPWRVVELREVTEP